jgi:hypothetical protein
MPTIGNSEHIRIPAVTNEVSGDQILLNITHDSLEVSLRCSPEKTISITLSVAFWKKQQNNRNFCRTNSCD